MKQDDVAGKILLELLELGLVEEKNEHAVYTYLSQAYAAGYDAGTRHTAHPKPVGQYSVEGKLIKIWDSITVAANHFHVDKSGISKVTRGKRGTCGGYRWEFINQKDPNASTKTIGSIPLESVRPTPRNRASKTNSVQDPPQS